MIQLGIFVIIIGLVILMLLAFRRKMRTKLKLYLKLGIGYVVGGGLMIVFKYLIDFLL